MQPIRRTRLTLLLVAVALPAVLATTAMPQVVEPAAPRLVDPDVPGVEEADASPAAAPSANRPDPIVVADTCRGLPVVRGELLVGFEAGAPAASREDAHRFVGSERIEEVVDGLDRVRLPAGLGLDDGIEAYRDRPGVAFAEPNLLQEPFEVPDDPRWWRQWGPQLVNVQDAWDVTKGDPSIVVAVIDTGADWDHPDLVDQMAYGWDFFANDPDPDDQKGHGTHVTGICGAATNNAVGIAGMGRDCRYAIYRTGNATLLTSAIVKSIRDARLRGFHVINMSFGNPGPSYGMQQELDLADQAGMVLVAAAGNGGGTAKVFPAGYANVIAVAASQPDDTRWPQSTYGSWVDVAAPGVDVHSTFTNAKYTDKSGTSVASPHVAGLAALLYTRLGGIRAKANADLVRQAIESSAVNVGTWVEDGRIDAWGAVQALQPWPAPALTSVQPATLPALGGTAVTLQGSGFTSAIALSWGSLWLGTGSFTIVDDATITLQAPTATSLGPQPVTVFGAGGASGASTVTHVETLPPALRVSATATGGQPLGWMAGGGTFDAWFLLVSLVATTQTVQGWGVLSSYQVLTTGTLDVAGLATASFPIAPSLVGTTVHSQVLDFDQQTWTFVGASLVQSTLVVP